MVGSKRDERDRERELSTARKEAGQGWSDHQEACRCPFQSQMSEERRSSKERTTHRDREEEGNGECKNASEDAVDSKAASSETTSEEVPSSEEDRLSPVPRTVLESQGERVQEQATAHGVHSQEESREDQSQATVRCGRSQKSESEASQTTTRTETTAEEGRAPHILC